MHFRLVFLFFLFVLVGTESFLRRARAASFPRVLFACFYCVEVSLHEDDDNVLLMRRRLNATYQELCAMALDASTCAAQFYLEDSLGDLPSLDAAAERLRGVIVEKRVHHVITFSRVNFIPVAQALPNVSFQVWVISPLPHEAVLLRNVQIAHATFDWCGYAAGLTLAFATQQLGRPCVIGYLAPSLNTANLDPAVGVANAVRDFNPSCSFELAFADIVKANVITHEGLALAEERGISALAADLTGAQALYNASIADPQLLTYAIGRDAFTSTRTYNSLNTSMSRRLLGSCQIDFVASSDRSLRLRLQDYFQRGVLFSSADDMSIAPCNTSCGTVPDPTNALRPLLAQRLNRYRQESAIVGTNPTTKERVFNTSQWRILRHYATRPPPIALPRGTVPAAAAGLVYVSDRLLMPNTADANVSMLFFLHRVFIPGYVQTSAAHATFTIGAAPATAPSPRKHYTVVGNGSMLYMLGGVTGSTNYLSVNAGVANIKTDAIWRFSFSCDTCGNGAWARGNVSSPTFTGADVLVDPFLRFGHAAIIHPSRPNTVVVSGGAGRLVGSSSTPLVSQDVWLVDIQSGSASPLAPSLVVPRRIYCSAVSYSGYLWFAGRSSDFMLVVGGQGPRLGEALGAASITAIDLVNSAVFNLAIDPLDADAPVFSAPRDYVGLSVVQNRLVIVGADVSSSKAASAFTLRFPSRWESWAVNASDDIPANASLSAAAVPYYNGNYNKEHIVVTAVHGLAHRDGWRLFSMPFLNCSEIPGTVPSAAQRACIPCPDSFYAVNGERCSPCEGADPLASGGQCPTAGSITNTQIGATVTAAVVAAVVLALLAWNYRLRREVETRSNTDHLVATIAEAVSRMNADKLQPLFALSNPSRTQRALQQVARVLMRYREFLPMWVSLAAEFGDLLAANDEDGDRPPNASQKHRHGSNGPPTAAAVRMTHLPINKLVTRSVSIVVLDAVIPSRLRDGLVKDAVGAMYEDLWSITKRLHGNLDSFMGDRAIVSFNALQDCVGPVGAEDTEHFLCALRLAFLMVYSVGSGTKGTVLEPNRQTRRAIAQEAGLRQRALGMSDASDNGSTSSHVHHSRYSVTEAGAAPPRLEIRAAVGSGVGKVGIIGRVTGKYTTVFGTVIGETASLNAVHTELKTKILMYQQDLLLQGYNTQPVLSSLPGCDDLSDFFAAVVDDELTGMNIGMELDDAGNSNAVVFERGREMKISDRLVQLWGHRAGRIFFGVPWATVRTIGEMDTFVAASRFGAAYVPSFASPSSMAGEGKHHMLRISELVPIIPSDNGVCPYVSGNREAFFDLRVIPTPPPQHILSLRAYAYHNRIVQETFFARMRDSSQGTAGASSTTWIQSPEESQQRSPGNSQAPHEPVNYSLFYDHHAANVSLVVQAPHFQHFKELMANRELPTCERKPCW